ncbi:hypothetical protein YH65_08235 [Sulfurovum lithotrophicum]|uniref:DUF2018 domain-containing protein n=1 Tax=Sulfurovum lithotrophicum TaxID=206403 RepID=A0A7U4M1Y7_9BACT|nr:DUF2018 family protein [Sulfurovum lithotrophicum]AKF25375.1 hypothetical protein YH65_08235 [Sulfurovum lithotrophicum]
MGIFEDDEDDYGMDFMGRTPKSTYFETAKTANQNIVEQELEKMFRRLAVAEKMLEDRGLDEELEREIKATIVDQEIEDRINTVFIDLVSSIVTQCE